MVAQIIVSIDFFVGVSLNMNECASAWT